MIPGMTICSAVQLRQSQSEEKWSGFTYFNASGDHFAKHQLSLTKRRACGFGVENGKRIVAVHKSAVRLPSSRNIPAHVSRFGLLPRTDIRHATELRPRHHRGHPEPHGGTPPARWGW